MTAADVIALSRDCVLLTALAVALYTDLTRGKVYNWCTVPAIVLGLLISYVAGAGDSAQGETLADVLGAPLIDGLSGLALALGVFGLAYLLGMLGGGDVKLMCAVGALKGLGFLLHAAVFTACFGAVIAVVVLASRRRLKAGLKTSVAALVAPGRVRKLRESPPEGAAELTTIPYVWAIVLGTVTAWILGAA